LPEGLKEKRAFAREAGKVFVFGLRNVQEREPKGRVSPVGATSTKAFCPLGRGFFNSNLNSYHSDYKPDNIFWVYIS
jgi:hypothetical protein